MNGVIARAPTTTVARPASAGAPDRSQPEPEPASEPASRPTRRRSDALDRFRGVALVAMLVQHLTDWYAGSARGVLPGWPSFAVTDVAAPAFFLAAGMSATLLVDGRRRRGVPGLAVVVDVVRRYGLLVPLGMALQWAMWRTPLGFGVLEALGLTVLAGLAVTAVVPRPRLGAVAGIVLVLGVVAERRVEGGHDWLAVELVGGTFPVLTYLGFVLAGMAVVRSGRLDDRRWVSGVAWLGAGALALMLADGIVPDRYPGNLPFVVPSLAGCAVAYAVAQRSWPPALAWFDRGLRLAATHTLGIFVSHYAIYYVLSRSDHIGGLTPGIAIALALSTTAAFCAAAPHVPQPPWSPRTGRRHP
jgi:heparan-alpha-glucosaminide N-acetyltransferase-like protein